MIKISGWRKQKNTEFKGAFKSGHETRRVSVCLCVCVCSGGCLSACPAERGGCYVALWWDETLCSLMRLWRRWQQRVSIRDRRDAESCEATSTLELSREVSRLFAACSSRVLQHRCNVVVENDDLDYFFGVCQCSTSGFHASKKGEVVSDGFWVFFFVVSQSHSALRWAEASV